METQPAGLVLRCHHPFLQTEELANEIALRLVGREVLAGVYEKVWKRTGSKGALVYLPVE